MAEAKLEHFMKLLEELTESQSDGPRVDRVFQKMIDPPYKGRVLFSHVPKMSPEDFPEFNRVEIIRCFRRYPDKFAVFEGNDGRVAMFGVLVKDAKLCWKSNEKPSECKDADCRRFHVCKKYVGGDCTGVKCPFDHHFQSEQSRKLLKRYDLEKYNDDQLLTIFRQSHLQVCNFYDRKGTCDNEDRCTKLHICVDFVQGRCQETCPKNLKHDFSTDHSKRLLRIYDLHDRREEEVLKQLLVMNHFALHRRDAPLKNNEVLKALAEALFNFGENEVEEKDDKSTLDACTRSDKDVDSRTKPGKEQTTVKVQMEDVSGDGNVPKISAKIKVPSYWEMEIFGDWRPLGKIRSQRLEEAYCDPENEAINITLPDIEECDLFDTLIKVNLNTMTAALLEDHDNDELKLRRVENPGDCWMWYFQTDENTWSPYPEDDQVLLESAFMVSEKRVFIGKKERYRVKFSDMTQRNRETGTERRVRRRPLMV